MIALRNHDKNVRIYDQEQIGFIMESIRKFTDKQALFEIAGKLFDGNPSS